MRFRRPNSLEFAGGWWRFLVLLFLVSRALAAEPMVVFLKNGDRVSGEITSENSSRVVLKSPVAGRLSIPRDQILRIISRSALAAEASPTNAPVAAVAAPPAAASPPPAAAATGPAKPAPSATPAPAGSQAAAPAMTSTNAPSLAERWLPGWLTGAWTNWHGNVQFGANVGWGTTDRYALFANASAAKKWGRTTSIVNYSVNYGAVNDVMNANRMRGDTRVEVDISKNHRLYAYGQGAGGYDEIRQIQIEYLMGGGMGYKFIDRPRLVLAGELGSQYQVFDYYTTSDKENVAARLGQSLTTRLPNNITLTQRLGFTPGFDDFSDYQVRFGLTLSMPLFKPLTLNLNLVDEYDSQPAPGVSKNDLQFSTTIGVSF